jgi:hypothetical protein
MVYNFSFLRTHDDVVVLGTWCSRMICLDDLPCINDLLERAISGIYESSSSSRDEKCCV